VIETELDQLDPRARGKQVTCVLTRIELAHWWQAPRLHLWYRRVRRSLLGGGEPLSMSLLRESARVYFTLSLWSNPLASMASATPEHVGAVRAVRGWGGRAWSTQWHLTRLSSSAHDWPGSPVDWPGLARESGAVVGHSAAFRYCLGAVADLRPAAVRMADEHEQHHR
jgi:hypothetical protein